MVSKGNAAHVARVRRAGGAATEAEVAPIKLKKKVVAVAPASSSSSTSSMSSSASSSATAATSNASPTNDREERPTSPQGWTPRTLGRTMDDTNSSPSHGAHQLQLLKGSPPQRRREKEDASPKDEQQVENNEGPASTPFVPIAPAKPGTMLPKDLIMAKYRVKPDAPKFLLMLYEILQHESNLVIRWTDDGLALQILDQANVTEKVLPKYFNHTNFHSFQRQLNYFGFRKWTKSKTDICTFSHPYFRRNQPELMHLIKRKKATRRVGPGEQTEMAEGAEPFDTAGTTTSSTSLTTSGAQKKLLPLSPSGKRRLAPETSEDSERRAFGDASGPNSSSASSASSSSSVPAQVLSSTGESFLPPAATLPNAISPASGGAKKKAKTASGSKSLNPTEKAPSGLAKTSSMLPDPVAIAAVGIAPGAFPKGALPNLDLVRNRLIYRQPPHGGSTGPMPGFNTTFPIAPNVNAHLGAGDNTGQNASTAASSSAPPVSGNGGPPNDPSNSMFSNSFSDPVDILLRIKKSRAMSQDNTLVQSPQQTQGQVEGFASLQNFLLSQSMYTNRLESQLKLAMEENDALRHLVDAKQREVEALLNERKMIQNENSVLTEDKNKLFEINRDLLSKLFPQ